MIIKNKKQKTRKFFSYNFFPKNRRANIPIVILVIGILAVCVLAIFSFSFSISKSSKSFSDISVIEEVKTKKEKLDFYGESLKIELAADMIAGVNSDQGGIFISGSNENIEVKYYLP